jgi:hypothetical protein
MADSTRQLPRYLTDRPSQQLLSQLPVHASMGRSGCWPWSPSGRSCTTRSAICGGRIPLTRRSEGRGSGRGPAHGRWRLPRLHLTFVLRAVGAERTRLLVRTCGTYAAWLLGRIMPAMGLFDATYGAATLSPSPAGPKHWPPRPQRPAGDRWPRRRRGWARNSTSCDGAYPRAVAGRVFDHHVRHHPVGELGRWPMTSRAPTGGAHAPIQPVSCSRALATGHMTRCWSVRRAG